MPLKSREYEDRCRAVGFEKGTQWAVSELIERHNMLERTLAECGQQLLSMTEILAKVTDGTVMIRQQVEALIRRDPIDESHPTPKDD